MQSSEHPGRLHKKSLNFSLASWKQTAKGLFIVSYSKHVMGTLRFATTPRVRTCTKHIPHVKWWIPCQKLVKKNIANWRSTDGAEWSHDIGKPEWFTNLDLLKTAMKISSFLFVLPNLWGLLFLGINSPSINLIHVGGKHKLGDSSVPFLWFSKFDYFKREHVRTRT